MGKRYGSKQDRVARTDVKFRERRQDDEYAMEGYEGSSKVCVEPKTANQKEYIKQIIKNDIVLCEGYAGTGKTCIAIGMGLQYLYAKDKMIDKIIIIRSVKGAGGEEEELGFMPGDESEKMAVWINPIKDNLKVYINDGQIECLLRKKQIEALAPALARGRSLNNCFIIVEEAQNFTPEQMIMILTRIGEDSKMVISGDITQNDQKNYVKAGSRTLPEDVDIKTGLEDAMERLKGMKNVGIVTMDEEDIVRNPMIKEILKRYNKLGLKRKKVVESKEPITPIQNTLSDHIYQIENDKYDPTEINLEDFTKND